MKNKVSKIILWIVGVIIAVLAFFWFLGAYGYDIQNYFIRQKQIKIEAQIEEEKAKILEAQKNDIYGGKTPEETLDLYITALKAGDIELASKYWEVSLERPSLQKNKVINLTEVLNQDGNFNVAVDNLKGLLVSKYKKYNTDGDFVLTYEYVTLKDATSTMFVNNTEYSWLVPKGEKESISMVLRLNPYTKVWKIIQ
jgi:hypothetical protein